MTGAVAAWAVLAACSAGAIVVGVRRPAVPVWASLLIAVALRVLFAAMTSSRFTPHDVRAYFYSTGELVLVGRDPLSHLPGREWNFLELMPYVHALEIRSGLGWVYAVKMAPIACDVVLVWLVAELAGSDRRLRALQYAINPVSLLVVSLHGQVEPVALALGLGGIVLARRGRWLMAGVLLGAAIAAKSWPALILVGVVPLTPWRKMARLMAGAATVPILVLGSGVAFLDTHPLSALRHILSYTSLVDNWGWAGLLVASGRRGVAGYGTPVGHVGSALVLAAVIVVVVVFRHHPVEARVVAVLCAVLVVTAAFGNQYLLWPLPLAFALGGGVRVLYAMAATLWAGIAYLAHWPPVAAQAFLAGLSWVVIATLVWLVWDVFNGPTGVSRSDPPGRVLS